MTDEYYKRNRDKVREKSLQYYNEHKHDPEFRKKRAQNTLKYSAIHRDEIKAHQRELMRARSSLIRSLTANEISIYRKIKKNTKIMLADILALLTISKSLRRNKSPKKIEPKIEPNLKPVNVTVETVTKRKLKPDKIIHPSFIIKNDSEILVDFN
jgi:hypothetical protein